MPSKQRILFADDEQRVLHGLRRQLHGQRAEWDMVFVPGGPEALIELGSGPFDVVVSDLRMPMVDGAQVLAHVAFDQPRAARLVLSGAADPDQSRLASSCAHRYLNKPCPFDTLQMEIRQALSMRALLDELGDERFDRIWSQPPGFLPECEGALEALRGDHAAISAEVLGRVRENEPLWLRVRGALCAALGDAADPSAAPRDLVSAAGARLALSVIMGARFLEVVEPAVEELWPDAVEVATEATAAARTQGLSEEELPDAFVAGLLSAFVGADTDDQRLDVLAWLLPTWGFTAPVVEALTAGTRRPAGRLAAFLRGH